MGLLALAAQRPMAAVKFTIGFPHFRQNFATSALGVPQ